VAVALAVAAPTVDAAAGPPSPERADRGRAAAARYDPTAGLTVHPEWGWVRGHGGKLRRGCRTYTYSYSIRPPEGTWAIEVFVTDPRGEHMAAGAFMGGYDPLTGTGRYKLCKVTTRPGRFTIVVKLSVDSGYGEITDGMLPPDRYRLRRPRR